MKHKPKRAQVVIRMTGDVHKKMTKAADACGLTNAAWARQIIIKALEAKHDPA